MVLFIKGDDYMKNLWKLRLCASGCFFLAAFVSIFRPDRIIAIVICQLICGVLNGWLAVQDKKRLDGF